MKKPLYVGAVVYLAVFVAIVLTSQLSTVIRANGDDEVDYDPEFFTEDNPESTESATVNNVVQLAAFFVSPEVVLKAYVTDVHLTANSTVNVDIYDINEIPSESTQDLLKLKFPISNVTCTGEANATCQWKISSVKQCASLSFETEETKGRAIVTTVTIRRGSVRVEQLYESKTLLRFETSCDNNITALGINLRIRDDQSVTSEVLDADCQNGHCMGEIKQHFRPCILYHVEVDGYSERILPFFHRSTARVLTEDILAKYSNETLIVTATFEGEKRCAESLQAVNIWSPEGFFQPQTMKCQISEEGYSSRCSGDTNVTNDLLICEQTVALKLTAIYGSDEEKNYTLESTAEYNVMVQKPDGWDIVKKVRALGVQCDREDVTIEWEDPYCPTGQDYYITLAAGLLASHDSVTQSISLTCSKLNEARNQVRIAQDGTIICRAGERLNETLKLAPCVNYSLSATQSVEEDISFSQTASFISPFHAKGVKSIALRALSNRLEVVWNMSKSCPALTELDAEVNNVSYIIKPYEGHASKGSVIAVCDEENCVVNWTVTDNVISCTEYLIKIGSAHGNITTPPGYDDYTGETPLVNILKEDSSFRIDFKFQNTARRCLPYLTTLEVILYQPFASRWTPKCLKASDSSFTCSQSVNFGYIDGCRSHNVSYRPWFSLKGNSTEVWNNEVIGPIVNSSTYFGRPGMLVSSENLNHLSVKWRTDTCLFGNIIKWNLSIEAQQQQLYSIEIPFNCSITSEMAASYEDGYEHSIQIVNNTLKCTRGTTMMLDGALQLASCNAYQVKIIPVVKLSHKEYLVSDFKKSQNLSTTIEPYDVQGVKIVDIEPQSFNIELKVPTRCSKFKLKQLSVNGETNERLSDVEVSACSGMTCILKLKNPWDAIPQTKYYVSLGSLVRVEPFVTPSENPGQLMMTLLKKSSIAVNWNGTSLEITFTIKGCVNNKCYKTRLDSVQLKMFDSPMTLFETINCDSILSNYSETSALCSKTIPVKALNGCRANDAFLRPFFNNFPKEDLDWVNFNMPPFFPQEEASFHVEATARNVDVTWRTPRCLITSHRITSWNLIIANDTNIYQAEFASFCNQDLKQDGSLKTRNDWHKLKIRNGKIECNAPTNIPLLHLRPCLNYSAKIYPVLEHLERTTAVAFTQSTGFIHLPDLEVQVLNVSATNLEVTFPYPAQCSGLQEMNDLLKKIRITSDTNQTIDQEDVQETKHCDVARCTVEWKLKDLNSSSSYSVLIGSQKHIIFSPLTGKEAAVRSSPADKSIVIIIVLASTGAAILLLIIFLSVNYIRKMGTWTIRTNSREVNSQQS